WLFDRRGWFAEALEAGEEVLRQARTGATKGAGKRAGGEEHWTVRRNLLQELAAIHQQLGHLQQAVRCLEEALVCGERAGLPDTAAGILNDLGITYTQMGRYDDALAALGSAIEITRRTGRTVHEAYVRNNR